MTSLRVPNLALANRPRSLTVNYWITYSGTASFTINLASAVTGTVTYHCFGRN
jgi:hypothetical protein